MLKLLLSLFLLVTPLAAQEVCTNPTQISVEEVLAARKVVPLKVYDGQWARDFVANVNRILDQEFLDTDIQKAIAVIRQDQILVMTFRDGCGVQAFVLEQETFVQADSIHTAN